MQLTAADVVRFRQDRSLPAESGFLALDGPAVVTSLRKEGQGTEVRLFNPYGFPVEVALVFFAQAANATGQVATCPAEVYPVDFESEPIGQPYPVENGRVIIPLAPKENMLDEVGG